MSEKTQCPTCKDKGKIQCPCCSGQGGTIMNFFPFGIGKAYSCSYCGGSGKVSCPRCSASKTLEVVENIKTHSKRIIDKNRSTSSVGGFLGSDDQLDTRTGIKNT